MANKFRRQSAYEIIEEHNIERERSHKRRSVFEDSHETTPEDNDKLDLILSKWDQRWSGFRTKDVRNAQNVETYSNQKHIRRVLKKETDMWLSGIKNMVGKIQEFEEQTEYIEIIGECDLPSKNRSILKKIDTKLMIVLEKTHQIINSCEVLVSKQERIKANIDPNIIKSKHLFI